MTLWSFSADHAKRSIYTCSTLPCRSVRRYHHASKCLKHSVLFLFQPMWRIRPMTWWPRLCQRYNGSQRTIMVATVSLFHCHRLTESTRVCEVKDIGDSDSADKSPLYDLAGMRNHITFVKPTESRTG